MVECTYTHNLDAIYQSLADPTRRDMLARICQQRQTISDLADNYQMSFAGVAKHINVLAKADLIIKTKHGKEQHIQANPATISIAEQHLHQYKQILQHRYNTLEQLLQKE